MAHYLFIKKLFFIVCLGFSVLFNFAWCADETPDGFIRRLSTDLLNSVRADAALRSGDINKISVMVDLRVMPHLNFQRMTASAVGPAWRQASPEQQKRLQEEFKLLLIRSYAGAMAQIKDQIIQLKPMRMNEQDTEVVVRTEIVGKGEPIQIDYRLEKTPSQGAGWKIYNLNILGVWLVETYRGQFAQEINAKGVDGLINTLTERNKSNARK